MEGLRINRNPESSAVAVEETLRRDLAVPLKSVTEGHKQCETINKCKQRGWFAGPFAYVVSYGRYYSLWRAKEEVNNYLP